MTTTPQSLESKIARLPSTQAMQVCTIIGIDCLDLVEEGGTLHCISQQQPA